MTKAKISEYDAVAANNTDVNGVNIAENCPPSGMNNMGREIMAALKRFQTGSDGDGVTVGGNLVVSGSSTLSTTSISSADINAGTIDATAIGGSTAAAGSFTTLNTSGAVVFNDAGADVDFRVEGDTDANLLFVDAGNDRVGIGVATPQNKFQIDDGGVSATGVLRLNNPANAGDNFGVQLLFSNVGSGPTYHSMASITAIRTNQAANYNSDLLFATQASSGASLTERMRINSAGHLLIATTTDNGFLSVNPNLGATEGTALAYFYGGGSGDLLFQSINSGGGSATNAGIKMGKNGTTGRSINGSGTINASGTDYAEYMTKCSNFTVAKGDVVGIDVNGKLTNVFANAISFVVKSTDPSYVGGDTWGSPEALGLAELRPLDQSASDEVKAQYAQDKAVMDTALETARQLVDRIAFCGQVPVNVMGATVGQYIVPIESNGGITGVAVNEADMTLAQYMKAVGKVIAIEENGRARIIVKVA
jgi:hypothetical protein